MRYRETLANISPAIELAILLVILAVALNLQVGCTTEAFTDEGFVTPCTKMINPVLRAVQELAGFEPVQTAYGLGAVMLLAAAALLYTKASPDDTDELKIYRFAITPVWIFIAVSILTIVQEPIGPLTTAIAFLAWLYDRNKNLALLGELRFHRRINRALIQRIETYEQAEESAAPQPNPDAHLDEREVIRG